MRAFAIQDFLDWHIPPDQSLIIREGWNRDDSMLDGASVSPATRLEHYAKLRRDRQLTDFWKSQRTQTVVLMSRRQLAVIGKVLKRVKNQQLLDDWNALRRTMALAEVRRIADWRRQVLQTRKVREFNAAARKLAKTTSKPKLSALKREFGDDWRTAIQIKGWDIDDDAVVEPVG